jgi:hypothetical protein
MESIPIRVTPTKQLIENNVDENSSSTWIQHQENKP